MEISHVSSPCQCLHFLSTAASEASSVPVSQSPNEDICTKYRDDGFCVDLGYFGHFRGTKIVGGGSQVDRLLLELDDWITAGKCLRQQEQ